MITKTIEQEEIKIIQEEDAECDLDICERIIIEAILFKIPKKSWMIKE